MTTRTRYFVITSLLVLTVGVGTGLLAYYVGFPMSASSRKGGPDELKYVPRDAAVVSYANVREVMMSQLRQKINEAVPHSDNGQREFQNETGINIETDIDHVVAFVAPGNGVGNLPGGGMVLARGRFDEVRIEALMREHGAHIEDYAGKRLIVADVNHAVRKQIERHRELGQPDSATPGDADTQADTRPEKSESFALAFVEPGLAAVGSASVVRMAIDLQKNAETVPNVTSNDDLMNIVRSLDGGTVWAVGRFDALQKQAKLPESVSNQLPPITWFSITSHVNGGIRGVIRAETRDEEAAKNLRDVLRGFMALAKLQAGSKPEYQVALQALELGGTGNTVALSFAVPSELFDIIGKAVKPAVQPAEKPVGH